MQKNDNIKFILSFFTIYIINNLNNNNNNG